MVNIVEFQSNDLKQVMALDQKTFSHRERPWSERFFMRMHQNFPNYFLVAKDQEKVVGFIIARERDSYTYISSLAISEDYQGHGLGTKLCQEIIDKSKKDLQLHVRKYCPAVSLYKKIGFEIIMELDNYYKNGSDAYLMLYKK